MTTILTKLFSRYILGLLLIAPVLSAQEAGIKKAYEDLSYKSNVFGYNKFYRIYLPEGYAVSKDPYPVIYFFHGWGGRHFKDDNALLEYEKIKELVDKFQVILVMWDGSMDGIEPRPYNVGYHEDIKFQVQMKDYFPELVNYIDSSYRTLTDREHRGIIGFSMGGFMALYLAGKYPQMVSSTVSLAGSPEFFVGYPENHTWYPVRYTFKNLQGVNVRMHNGDSDILYFLNDEVYKGALWEGFPVEYRKFHGGHMVDKTGETKVFEMAMAFIVNYFKEPSKPPQNWTHFDIYNNFSVWDYQVISDKHESGYITLRNVDKTGLGIYSPRWLPLGPPSENININITTPSLYLPDKKYQIVKYNKRNRSIENSIVVSNNSGQLKINTDGAGSELGIYQEGDTPHFIFLDYTNNRNSKYLKAGQQNRFTITLFNRGGGKFEPEDMDVKISTADSTIIIDKNDIHAVVRDGNRVVNLMPVNIVCKKQPSFHAEPSEVKFTITIITEKGKWNDDFIVPVMFDVPYFNDLKIDDGIKVRDTVCGVGNADGKADAGERILIYRANNRLRLYTEDKYVIREDEHLADEIIPARWPDGYTMSSIVHISPDCPPGHIIECEASYETKEFNPIERKLTWGKVKIMVNSHR